MTLIALKNAELAFGLTPLLDGASLAIQAGDRVGLIGRNGTGKSSLLSALLGTLPLDACASFDTDESGTVTVDELLRAVNDALNGCAEAGMNDE